MKSATYDELGKGYALRRQSDPRIATQISEALGDAATLLNVGAGAGSYEPADRPVCALEPSGVMIRQRPMSAAPCVQGSAEALPFQSGAFDAAMALLTVHHWGDWRLGLRELKRVSRRRVVILTFDPSASRFWLTEDYLPELLELDRAIMPRFEDMENELGPFASTPVMIPHDCRDGFLGAFWRRPQVYLDPAARRSMSPFASIDAAGVLERLARDLEDGAWARRHQDLLVRDVLDVGYRLLRWDYEFP